MSTVLDGLYYSESHEWLKVEGEFGYIGITDYAQHQLGNVVYVDLPEVDDELNQGEEFGADRKSTRLNSSHMPKSRMPSSA